MTRVAGLGCLWLAVWALSVSGSCSRRSPQQPAPKDAHIINQGSAPPSHADEAPASGGEPCGAVKCAADEVCCNQSCGICTPPGGVCTQQFCEPEPPKVAGGECKVNADCRATADYCTGCDCRALAPHQELPACAGPGVRCFADPCLTKTAVCKAGRCEIAPKP